MPDGRRSPSAARRSCAAPRHHTILALLYARALPMPLCFEPWRYTVSPQPDHTQLTRNIVAKSVVGHKAAMRHVMTSALYMGYTAGTLHIYLLPPGGSKVCTSTSHRRWFHG